MPVYRMPSGRVNRDFLALLDQSVRASVRDLLRGMIPVALEIAQDRSDLSLSDTGPLRNAD